jgi:hypothetical protein
MQQSNKSFIEFLPNFHDLMSNEGRASQRELYQYLTTQIEKYKTKHIVIFFESGCDTTSFKFNKYPDAIVAQQKRIQKSNPKAYRETANKLLALEWVHQYIMDELNGNVNIQYIPVPCFGDHAQFVARKIMETDLHYMDNIFQVFKKYRLPYEYIKSFQDLVNVNDLFLLDANLIIELNQIQFDMKRFLKSLFDDYPPDALKNKKDQKNFEKEFLNALLQTSTLNSREYLTIREIGLYLKSVQNHKEHKYYLIFGLNHFFEFWNSHLEKMYFKRVDMKSSEHCEIKNYPIDKYPYFNYRRKSIVDFVDQLEKEQ